MENSCGWQEGKGRGGKKEWKVPELAFCISSHLGYVLDPVDNFYPLTFNFS